MPKETYLGDGLYASFDGWQICLRAPREDGDHVVYLDQQIWKALGRVADEYWNPTGEKVA